MDLSIFFQRGIASFVQHYEPNGTVLKFPLQYFYCPSDTFNQVDLNTSIASLTAGYNVRPWHGALVILRFSSFTCIEYADMRGVDVLVVRDYLVARG